MEINQEKREKVEVFVPTEEAIKELREALEPFVSAFKEVCERLAKFFRNLWDTTKAVAIKWYQLEEKKRVVVRQRHKRDFSRQKISQQVIDRKPQHMVWKIIR